METKDLYSEIIHKKKQLIFEVTQTHDFILPNQKYRYQIYCKNVDETTIENLTIKVINPYGVIIDEPDSLDSIVSLGDLKPGESKLLYLTSRCAIPALYSVHFLAYGNETGLFYKTLEIDCNYTKTESDTTHIISFYDFSPYEDTYRLEVDDFNDNVTQLTKIQKPPYQIGNQPFPMINEYSDESQSYIDQYNTLKNTDEYPYQYIARESYTVKKPESEEDIYQYKLYELQDEDGNVIYKDNKPVTEYKYIKTIEEHRGKNFKELLRQINLHSQYFRAKYLRNGNNEILNDFTEIKPDGFIYRFGLLNSEIYHYLGVLPTYTYMSDFLFRWAPTESNISNLYPRKKAMHWGNTNMAGKKWAGHGFQVWQYYDNDDENIHTAKKLYTFTDKKIAEEYVNKNIKYDKGINATGYTYKIKETFDDTGVFFINIPIEKIPANFYKLDVDEIESIIQRSKPYGVKCLIRYNISKNFNQDMSMHIVPRYRHHFKFDMSSKDKFIMLIKNLRYQIVQKEICSDNKKITIESLELIPYGRTFYNGCRWRNDIKFIPNKPQFKIMNKSGASTDNSFNQDMNISYNTTSLKENNSLTNISSLKEILYYNRFENISFRIESYLNYMRTVEPSNTQSNNSDPISDENTKINYKLWIQALKSDDYHITVNLNKVIPEEPIGEEIKYYKVNDKKANLFYIPISSGKFQKDGVEIGLAFTDGNNKIHGLSSEYNNYINENYIKYVTSYRDNYKLQKDGYEKIIGLAFQIIPININNDLIIFYIEKNENNNRTLNYFTHIIVPEVKDASVFIRDQADNPTSIKESKILQCTYNLYNNVVFQTPAFKECKLFDIKDAKQTIEEKEWKNLYRIDKAENSYAYIQNTSNDIINANDIILHFDDLNIPDQSIIKNINLKTIIESNVTKEIYCGYDTQDNIYYDTKYNDISFAPQMIECYSSSNEDIEYYQNQYDAALYQDNKKKMEYYENKIIENILLDESVDYSLDFLKEYDKYISIKKPFWSQISDFTNLSYSFNNIENIEFVIEGYNSGPEVDLATQLTYDSKVTKVNKTKIEAGYFYKKIKLNQESEFFLDGIKLRYQFLNLNNEIKIFDYHINVTLKNKKESEYNEYIESDVIEVKEKKYRNINIINEDSKPYNFNNGLTVILKFDNLYPGEIFKIYSTELEIVYQDTNMNIIAQKGKHTTEAILDTKEENKTGNQINYDSYTLVRGDEKDSYISGLFYNDQPTALQENDTTNTYDKGAELRDNLYQSFTANADNITSIELFPNGFKGNPSSVIKIALYENHGFTPGKLIKEIYTTGWTKSNEELKYLDSIKYNINVDNLKIGEKYWFKLEVINPNNNGYYLLKNNNKNNKEYKLLSNENDNYINLFSSLKFVIYSIANTNSFGNIPAIQKKFVNPFVKIGLNRNTGEIQKLRVKDKKEELVIL